MMNHMHIGIESRSRDSTPDLAPTSSMMKSTVDSTSVHTEMANRQRTSACLLCETTVDTTCTPK